MATNTQVLAQALEVGLRKIVGLSYREKPEMWRKLVNFDTTGRQTETDQGFTDFGPMSEITEGGAVPYDDPFQGFTTSYTQRKYGLGFKVTEEMRMFDQNNVIRKMPDRLGRSARHTKEFSVWNLLNNAFSTSFLGADGKPLLSLTHVAAGTGTAYANRPSTPVNLTAEALEQMDIDMMTTVDDRGKFMQLMVKCLFVAPYNWGNVKRIMETDKEVGTGNNTTNVMAGRYDVEVVPYLTSTKAWFGQADMHEVNYLEAMPFKFGNDGDFDTDNWKYKLKGMWTTGWSDPRGMYGDAGV